MDRLPDPSLRERIMISALGMLVTVSAVTVWQYLPWLLRALAEWRP